MTTLFISDLHLTPERPAGIRAFERFTREIAASAEELYILGDLFDYWIGDDACDYLGHGHTLRLLRDISGAGVRLYVMRGNRDFLLGEQFAAATGCVLLEEPTPLRVGGLSALLAHGDGLCTDDVDHQAFRRQVRAHAWQAGFLARPIAEREAAARALRYQSDELKAGKPLEIMDVNPNAVESLMREHDVELLIHGHTHRPGMHELAVDGRPARRIVLGDWLDQASVLRVQADRFLLSPDPTATGPRGRAALV